MEERPISNVSVFDNSVETIKVGYSVENSNTMSRETLLREVVLTPLVPWVMSYGWCEWLLFSTESGDVMLFYLPAKTKIKGESQSDCSGIVWYEVPKKFTCLCSFDNSTDSRVRALEIINKSYAEYHEDDIFFEDDGLSRHAFDYLEASGFCSSGVKDESEYYCRDYDCVERYTSEGVLVPALCNWVSADMLCTLFDEEVPRDRVRPVLLFN